ncbi:MAG: Uma2 family endonuclease [Tepidisphaeraceae bacterium]
MTISTKRMTARQFLLLGEDPPGVRLELVNGEVAVSPSPTPDHQEIVLALGSLLREHVQSHNLGRVFLEVDTILGRHEVRRPDLLYFSTARLNQIGKKSVKGPPDLCVEVVSFRSRQTDRKRKFDLYRKSGVAHDWIVDPTARTIEAHRLEEGEYVLAGKGAGREEVRLAPFEELGIPLGMIWPASK